MADERVRGGGRDARGDRGGRRYYNRPLNLTEERARREGASYGAPTPRPAPPGRGSEALRRRAAKSNIRAVPGKRTSGRSPRSPVRHPRRKTHYGFIWGLFFTFVAGYLVFSILYSNTVPSVSETRVVMGSIDLADVYGGVILREERVYTSEEAGVMVFNVNDGERVKKGQLVGSVQDAVKVVELETALSAVNQSIIDLQSARGDYSLYSAEIHAANTQVKKSVDNAGLELSAADLSGLYALREDVQSTLDARNQMLLSENRGSLISLVQEKDIYEQQLADSKANIYAQQSGVVSYQLDGFEGLLSPDNINTLTRDQTGVSVDSGAIIYSAEVYGGGAVFKVIESNEWYLAAYLPEEAASGLSQNSSRTIYVLVNGEYAAIEATVFKSEESGGGWWYTVFRTNKNAADLRSERSVSFKLSDKVNEGYKIPNTAIAEKTLLAIPRTCVFTDESKGSVVTKAGSGDLISISSVTSDDEYVYIYQDNGAIALGEELDTAVSEEGEGQAGSLRVSQVRSVKGVYVTNTGVAVYRLISLGGGSSANSEYTVLDPSQNTGFQLHDLIVTDAKTVDNKQVVN